MTQFDVYRNTGEDYKTIPYLLNVQSDLLAELDTRVVAPLYMATHFGAAARILNPVFEIENHPCVLSIAELAGIPRSLLRQPVTNLAARRNAIVSALDLLVSGI